MLRSPRATAAAQRDRQDKVSYSYQVFWNACKLMAKGASSTEKADLFAGTAMRFYRLNGIG